MWYTQVRSATAVAGIPSSAMIAHIPVMWAQSSLENPAAGGSARLVIGTHQAREQDLSETVERLAASGVVERVVSVLRVEGN